MALPFAAGWIVWRSVSILFTYCLVYSLLCSVIPPSKMTVNQCCGNVVLVQFFLFPVAEVNEAYDYSAILDPGLCFYNQFLVYFSLWHRTYSVVCEHLLDLS